MSFRESVFHFQPHASWFYRASISEIMAPVHLDAVVRFEHLEEDLFRLPPIAEAVWSSGGPEPLPHLNPAPHPDRDKVCMPELTEAIADRWSADFDLYEKVR